MWINSWEGYKPTWASNWGGEGWDVEEGGWDECFGSFILCVCVCISPLFTAQAEEGEGPLIAGENALRVLFTVLRHCQSHCTGVEKLLIRLLDWPGLLQCIHRYRFLLQVMARRGLGPVPHFTFSVGLDKLFLYIWLSSLFHGYQQLRGCALRRALCFKVGPWVLVIFSEVRVWTRWSRWRVPLKRPCLEWPQAYLVCARFVASHTS